jgi:hypothetical protein
MLFHFATLYLMDVVFGRTPVDDYTCPRNVRIGLYAPADFFYLEATIHPKKAVFRSDAVLDCVSQVFIGHSDSPELDELGIGQLLEKPGHPEDVAAMVALSPYAVYTLQVATPY